MEQLRRRLIFGGKVADPYADMVVGEFTLTAPLTLPVVLKTNDLRKLVIDGEVVPATENGQTYDFSEGCHKVGWQYTDPAVILATAIPIMRVSQPEITNYYTTIPACVREIKAYGLRGVPFRYPLRVVAYPTTPPLCGFVALGLWANVTLKIYVPDESVEQYKSAPEWSEYAYYINPLSELGGGS